MKYSMGNDETEIVLLKDVVFPNKEREYNILPSKIR